MPAKVSGTLLCNIGVCTVVIWAHSSLTRGPNRAKNGQKLAQKAFFAISAIFGLGTKVRPFLEMAYRAGLDGSFGFLTGGHFWPFLALFGPF